MLSVDEDRYARERWRMVARLRRRGAVADPRVVAALGSVPRHLFIEGPLRQHAYREHALPIAGEQTISNPGVVARMTELLGVEGEDKVLEVGTGSGYQTALLAHLARRVYSLERIPELARAAIARMRELGIDNVKIQVFDGSRGWPEQAPFRRILVTAGAPRVPEPLLEQLAPGGRLLVPEGRRGEQRLVIYERRGTSLHRREADEVAFVPLVGRHGWSTAEE